MCRRAIIRPTQGPWSRVAQCQCATSLFQAFRRDLGFGCKGCASRDRVRLPNTAYHSTEVHNNDIYSIMIINCQIHTVCLGIVSSIIVPSFGLWRRARESRGHLCFRICLVLATLFSTTRCITLFASLTLVVFIFLLRVSVPRFVHPTDDSISGRW